MVLSTTNETRLKGVHPDLLKVVRRAAQITKQDFTVIQGARSAAEQVKNIAKGVSKTSRSRHVRANNKNGYACAVDLAPVIGGIIPWKRWEMFAALNKVMMQAAKEVNVPIEWGGNWKTIKDGDHWQLPWRNYP